MEIINIKKVHMLFLITKNSGEQEENQILLLNILIFRILFD
jgi:hypothetical protein